ncbi:MAG: PAS domain S-box protein, partial [Pseudomonadota bacterium]|nr:PAS domain S-box protein [Pseudomonadota bacterium]
MNPGESPLPGDDTDEIAGLIARLHETEQRLEQLTAGQVDTVTDRHGRTFTLSRAQEQIRHVEAAKQAAVLNALPSHIALLDPSGEILSVNEAWRQFAAANEYQGVAAGVGLNYVDIAQRASGDHSSTAHLAAAGIRSVLSGAKSSFSIEYPCHSPQQERWFLMTVTPLAPDRCNGAVVMHVNISERKQAEEAQRQSEARYRALFEHAPDGIVIADPAGYYIDANASVCRMLGYTREELVRLQSSDVVAPEELQHIGAALHALTTTSDYHREWQLRRKDGSFFAAEVIGTAMPDGNLLVMIRDITERKRVLDDLRESERRFSQIANNISDVFYLVDASTGQMLYVSPAYESLSGRSCASLYEHPESWMEAIHPDDRAAAYEKYRAGMALGT